MAIKRTISAQAEILEYWLVNLVDRQLIVHREPIDGDDRSIQTLTSGSITLLAFPDVTIEIHQLI